MTYSTHRPPCRATRTRRTGLAQPPHLRSQTAAGILKAINEKLALFRKEYCSRPLDSLDYLDVDNIQLRGFVCEAAPGYQKIIKSLERFEAIGV